MKLEAGLSTGVAYRSPLRATLEPIRRAGFRTVEIATAPGHLDLDATVEMERLAAELRGLGLAAPSLHAPFGTDLDFTDRDPAVREKTLVRLTRAADAARIFGCRLYVVHPGGEDHAWIWERESRLARSVDALNRLWNVCRERGLMLVVETPLPHLLGGQIDDFSWILERLPAEGVGVCVDTSHCTLGKSLHEAIERFSGRLVHVQASDNRGVTDDHLAPGDGVIAWEQVLTHLDRVGYAGAFLLELSPVRGIEEDVRHAAERVRELRPTGCVTLPDGGLPPACTAT